MSPDLTYEAYAGAGGELGADDYLASLPCAEAFVRGLTWPRVPSDEAEAQAYARAVFAGVEVDAQHGATGGVGGDVRSVSIGSFSQSFGSEGDQASNGWLDDMRRACHAELVGTGLLYAGLR